MKFNSKALSLHLFFLTFPQRVLYNIMHVNKASHLLLNIQFLEFGLMRPGNNLHIKTYKFRTHSVFRRRKYLRNNLRNIKPQTKHFPRAYTGQDIQLCWLDKSIYSLIVISVTLSFILWNKQHLSNICLSITNWIVHFPQNFSCLFYFLSSWNTSLPLET